MTEVATDTIVAPAFLVKWVGGKMPLGVQVWLSGNHLPNVLNAHPGFNPHDMIEKQTGLSFRVQSTKSIQPFLSTQDPAAISLAPPPTFPSQT